MENHSLGRWPKRRQTTARVFSYNADVSHKIARNLTNKVARNFWKRPHLSHDPFVAYTTYGFTIPQPPCSRVGQVARSFPLGFLQVLHPGYSSAYFTQVPHINNLAAQFVQVSPSTSWLFISPSFSSSWLFISPSFSSPWLFISPSFSPHLGCSSPQVSLLILAALPKFLLVLAVHPAQVSPSYLGCSLRSSFYSATWLLTSVKAEWVF